MQTVTALTAPRFPHLLTSGVCSLCPSAPRWWVYRQPKTGNSFCMDCLVAAASDPDADPAIAAIGREILEARQQDAPRPTPPVPTTPKPLNIKGKHCTDCGTFGPVWSLPNGCEHFCRACTGRYIAWEEAELTQARAAFAALPLTLPARPYHRLARCGSRYLRAA